MSVIYFCNICRSKLLENRVKKHHEKVHPNINHDIYIPVVDLQAAVEEVKNPKESSAIEDVYNLEAPKDDAMVHVRCDVCQNKMPKSQIESHMKRKHAEPSDQVDAIGINVQAISLKSAGNPGLPSPKVSLDNPVNLSQVNAPSKFGSPLSVGMPMAVDIDFSSDIIAFGRNFRPEGFEKETESKPTQHFYNIRLTEEQMHKFLEEKLLYPKDGALYLK